MGKSTHPEGTQEFPDLDALIGGYFHQDFDIYGGSLADVLSAFRKDTANDPGSAERVRADIARFLASCRDDAQLDVEFERMFLPQVTPGGWDEGVTNWRQWLTRIAELMKV